MLYSIRIRLHFLWKDTLENESKNQTSCRVFKIKQTEAQHTQKEEASTACSFQSKSQNMLLFPETTCWFSFSRLFTHTHTLYTKIKKHKKNLNSPAKWNFTFKTMLFLLKMVFCFQMTHKPSYRHKNQLLCSM